MKLWNIKSNQKTKLLLLAHAFVNVFFEMLAVLCMPHTVYPKKFAHGFCFVVLCCGYTLTGFPISIRLTSLALLQSNDCPSASKATLMNMDKYFMWIHYERLHNHNKAKHNKTVCIFLGIYCILLLLQSNIPSYTYVLCHVWHLDKSDGVLSAASIFCVWTRLMKNIIYNIDNIKVPQLLILEFFFHWHVKINSDIFLTCTVTYFRYVLNIRSMAWFQLKVETVAQIFFSPIAVAVVIGS